MAEQKFIEVRGAREHNLKGVDVAIPRDQLVVITGLSGSGKSSLAFDTIYAEGQRRYVESLSAYARQFLEMMQKPDVEHIDGLSPAISIEQKTTSRNPRSTVATVTEIYDYMRLLWARVGVPYSPVTGEPISAQTVSQMVDRVMQLPEGTRLYLLAPVVRGRKGEYRRELAEWQKAGYTRVRINGEMLAIEDAPALDKKFKHDIEVVVDRIKIGDDRVDRLAESVRMSMRLGDGMLQVLDLETENVLPATFSRNLMCPDSGISYEEPSPNTFSFNSPYGMCPHCKGLGEVHEVDMARVIPDDTKSINDVGIVPLGEVRENMMFKQLRELTKKHKFSFSTPVKDIPPAAMQTLLHGGDEPQIIGRNYLGPFDQRGEARELEKRQAEGEGDHHAAHHVAGGEPVDPLHGGQPADGGGDAQQDHHQAERAPGLGRRSRPPVPDDIHIAR